MRGDDQAFELLVGVIGKREHDPRRARAGLACGDFDAADDACGIGRGGHLQPVALIRIALDGFCQIDGVRVQRHAHGFDRRSGNPACERKDCDGDEQKSEPTHNVPVVSAALAACLFRRLLQVVRKSAKR